MNAFGLRHRGRHYVTLDRGARVASASYTDDFSVPVVTCCLSGRSGLATHRCHSTMSYWSRGVRRALLAPPLVLFSSIAPPTKQDAPSQSPSSDRSPSGKLFKHHQVQWDRNWDHREHQRLKKEEEAAAKGAKPSSNSPTRHIYLIRHGQYVAADSDEARMLSTMGREQAVLTGRWLRETGIKFNKITYSTMTRATETAQLISAAMPNVPATSCNLCREGAPVQPEPAHSTWRPKPHTFFIEGARIEAAFRQYFHRPEPEQTEDSHEIIVCHGNVIRYWVCRALQLPPEAWLRMSVANCSLTILNISADGHVGLRAMGEAAYLPYKMITFN